MTTNDLNYRNTKKWIQNAGTNYQVHSLSLGHQVWKNLYAASLSFSWLKCGVHEISRIYIQSLLCQIIYWERADMDLSLWRQGWKWPAGVVQEGLPEEDIRGTARMTEEADPLRIWVEGTSGDKCRMNRGRSWWGLVCCRGETERVVQYLLLPPLFSIILLLQPVCDSMKNKNKNSSKHSTGYKKTANKNSHF